MSVNHIWKYATAGQSFTSTTFEDVTDCVIPKSSDLTDGYTPFTLTIPFESTGGVLTGSGVKWRLYSPDSDTIVTASGGILDQAEFDAKTGEAIGKISLTPLLLNDRMVIRVQGHVKWGSTSADVTLQMAKNDNNAGELSYLGNGVLEWGQRE